MKFTTTRADLLPAISLASETADMRGTIPILGHALFSVADGWLDVQSTDLEMCSKSSLPVVAEGSGSVVLPIKPLNTFLKSLPKSASVDITVPDDETSAATLTSGHTSVILARGKIEDFPSLMGGVLPIQFKMPADELARIFRQVRPAMSTEETRYYLNGIFLSVAKDFDAPETVLRAVATDGHKLLFAETDLPKDLADSSLAEHGANRGVLIPLSAVGVICGLLGTRPSGSVTIRMSDVRLSIRIGRHLLLTKLIDGTFPEYQRVIPRENPNVLRTDSGECGSLAWSLARSVSKERSTPVKFNLSADSCVLSASGAEGAAASSKLNGITSYDGDPMEIGFQARYVRELLGLVEGPVDIRLGESGRPVVITAERQPGWKAVLMPMRV